MRPPAPIAAGPLPADALAASLRESVDTSGLFYESHLAQWVRGERPLASILREPQAGWSHDKRQPAADSAASPQPTRSPGIDSPPAVKGHPEIMEAGDGDRRDAAGPNAIAPNHRSTAGEPADPSAGSARDMVARQLHVLESDRIVWEGDVWPRQRIRLAIEGEPDPRPSATPVPPRAWNVKLSAVLPELGQVDAILRFDGTRASVALSAAPAAADALAIGCAAFEAALAAAGVPVSSTVVTHRG